MREHRYPGRGLELAVCEWGPEDGPAVLVLHGWLDQGAAWRQVAEPLADQGFRVLCPDQRGHGHSDHVGHGGYYHFPDYLADVDALLTGLDLPIKLLVGHSMGATIASMYAAAVPERVPRLMLVEGLGPVQVGPSAAADQLRTHLQHMRRPARRSHFATIEEAAQRLVRFTPSLSAPEAVRLARRSTQPHPSGGWTWRWDPLHRTRSPTAFDLERYLVQLQRIACPSTLVLGENSWYAGMDRLDERIEALGPSRVVRLPHGHNLHLDCPGAVADEALRMLSD